MDSISISKSEYSPKKTDYVTPIKPKENNFLIKDTFFQHETSNFSDFGPKSIQRITPVKPLDSNILKVIFLTYKI